MFQNNLGDKHDEMMVRIKVYLLKKAVEIIRNNGNVILEWGFWTHQDRRDITQYFEEKNVNCEWHYMDVSEEDWKQNIKNRNEKVLAGEATDYFVDEGLLGKLTSLFETPAKEEMDYWHCSNDRE